MMDFHLLILTLKTEEHKRHFLIKVFFNLKQIQIPPENKNNDLRSLMMQCPRFLK